MRRELPGGDSATVPVPNHREVAKGTIKSIIVLRAYPNNPVRSRVPWVGRGVLAEPQLTGTVRPTDWQILFG